MFRKVVVSDPSFSSTARFSVRLALIASAILMLCQTSGCAGNGWPKLYQDTVIKYRDMVWARRAYNLRYGDCQRDYSQHFENGFEAGYSATCDGGDGYVPALPPADYRGFEYQTADGARCVNSWFEGYPAGVAAARNDSAGTYHDVLISRMIDSAIQQDKSKTVLPGDPRLAARTDVSSQDAPPVPRGIDRLYPASKPAVAADSAIEGSAIQLPDGSGGQSPTAVVPTGFQSPYPSDLPNLEGGSLGAWNPFD